MYYIQKQMIKSAERFAITMLHMLADIDVNNVIQYFKLN